MEEMKINEQIAFLRKQKGLTQEEVANALGVTNDFLILVGFFLIIHTGDTQR